MKKRMVHPLSEPEERIIMDTHAQTIVRPLEPRPVAPRKTKQLLELLEAHRGERHIVALQDFPDPDAISSAWAHSFICEQFNITVDTFYEGTISHQENQALVRLLDIEMQKYDEGVDLSRYQASVFIDNQGTTTKLTERLKTLA